MDAIEVVRQAYTNKMIGTLPTDSAARDRWHLAIHALTDVENALTAFVQSGDIEKSQAVKKEKAQNATRDKRKRTS